jgi:hypothetical protein
MRHHPARSLTLLIATVAIAALIAGCGGDGGGGPDTSVTLSYPSGRIMAVGAYEPGTTTRTGVWKEYFDQAGSPQQWRKTYIGGIWDKTRDWREWNADGSVRNDITDR